MQTIFDGPVWLSYSQAYLTTGDDEYPQVDVSFAGRTNGLCGAALLQLWRAEPAPDRVVRQTSETAAYWHDFARDQPSPEETATLRRARLEHSPPPMPSPPF